MWVWTRDKKHVLKGCQTWCGLLLNIWILTAVKANSHSKGLSCVKTCFWSSSSAYLLFFSIVNFHEFLALKQHNCFQELFFGVLRLQIFFLISKIILWWTFLLSKSKSIWQRAICYIFGFSSNNRSLYSSLGIGVISWCWSCCSFEQWSQVKQCHFVLNCQQLNKIVWWFEALHAAGMGSLNIP